MMKKFYILLIGALFCLLPLSAQIFEISKWGSDDALAFPAKKNSKGEWVKDPSNSVRFDAGFEFQSVDHDGEYYYFAHEGKFYAIYEKNLKFSSKNPDDVENPLSEEQQKRFTLGGWFYSSMAAVITMLLVMGFGAIISFLYFKGILKDKSFVLKVIPGAILINSLILIYGQLNFGSEIFWWCDYDRYGFFGSLLRVIPFMAILFIQIISIKIYEIFLFDGQTESEDGTELKISIKPAALSLILCLPATIGTAIILSFLDIRGFMMDTITLVVFFGSLGWGMLKTYRKNVKLFGALNGLMMTIFSSVYIIGCLIAAIALITLIFKIIFQILVVLGTLLILAMVIPKRTFRGSDGRIYEEY